MIATDYHKQLFKVMPLQSVLLAVDAPKYTIVYVNDAYLKTTNTTENDIIGKGIFEAFPNNPINPDADEVKILTLSLATTLKTKQPQKTVCQQYNIPINGTNNFEVRYFDCDNIPILNNNGDVEFLLHTIVDVTDVTKSTKQQLEINRIKSNQDALINGTNNLIWSIDVNYCIITANEAYLQTIEATTHKTPKEGDSVFCDAFGEELINKWRDYYAKGLSGQHYSITEYFYNPTTYRNEYQIVSFHPMYTETGKVFGVACFSKDITDDIQIQKAYEHTKTELNNLLNVSLDVICVVNEEGFFLQVSAAAFTILGYKPEEMIGKNITDFIYEQDIQKSQNNAANVMAGKKAIHFENRYKHKNGSLVWMEWSASWDEQSRVRYGIARDITELKKNEAALIESEKKYKTLFENNPSPMFIWDFETLQILDCNEETLLKYGYTKAEFLQLTIKDISPKEDIALIEKATVSEAVYGDVHKQIWRHQKKNGDLLFMDISAHLIDYDGKRAALVVLIDVTEKLKVEEQIKNSESKYRSLVENSLDAILLTIKNGPIISANASAYKIFQMTEEEICNAGRDGLVDLTDPRLPILLQELKLTGKATGELTFKRIDGTTFSGDITTVIFRDLNGEEKSSITIRDITDKQNAIQQLLQSNQRFKYATKATSDAIWDWDIVANTLFWGEGHEIIFGYEKLPTNVDINYWTKYLHPQDLDRLVNSISILLNGKETNWEDEFRYLKADNTYAFVVNRGFVIRDERGNAIRMVGALQDITKRKKEDQHRKLLETVITNTTDAVLITETESFDELGPHIIYVNEAFTKMTGYTEVDVIGKTTRIFWGSKTDKEELEVLDEALKKFESCEITIINYKKNGEPFWNNIIKSPVADSKGWFTHWISIERDVTKQKKVELSKQLLKNITELFNKPLNLNQILRQVLAQLANYIEIGMAELWLISNDKKSINLISYFAETKAIKDFYNQTTQYTSYSKGQSLPGIIWEKATIQEWANLAEIKNFMRKDASIKAGLQSAFGLPINYNNEVIGVIILASTKTQGNTNEFEDLFKTIAATIGVEIKRKLAEESIKESESRMRLIMNAALDAIICIDSSNNITFWNPQAEEIFGWEEVEVMGKSLSSFIIPEASRAKHEEGMKHYLKTGKAYVLNALLELTAITRTGETLRIELTLIPIKQTDGEFFCAFIRDITHKKIAEEKLKSERNLLRTLIDNIPDTIYVKDAQARKLISNKVDYTLLGKSNEAEVLGKTDLELFDDHLGGLGHNHDMQILQTGQPVINFEQDFINKDGTPLWLLSTKVPLLNDANEIIGILGIGRDITERKIAVEKLKESNSNLEKHIKEIAISNQELEQFAYVASHDLQEPLRMITSFLTQLEKKYGNVLDEKGKKYIDFAVDGAKRMRQIILDLLEYSRVGRTDSQEEHIDLNILVDEIKILCSKQIKENKAIITVAHLPTIISHATPLRQVFQNLISNALKYVKPNATNTTINISVLEVNNEWQFAIADNGIGISKEYFAKIFILFQRLHTKEEFVGTGMGLAVTKKIIDNQGGRIWVESEEGVGSTFYFTLPKNK